MLKNINYLSGTKRKKVLRSVRIKKVNPPSLLLTSELWRTRKVEK